VTDPDEPVDEARRGWDSDFGRFASTPSNAIVGRLRTFLSGASLEQVRAWDDSIPRLQAEVTQVSEVREEAARYTAILEYELPLESRRADAIFLLRECVVVIELKGKVRPSDADIDQAHAYARDLRCYHAECEHREVHALLVPTGAAVILVAGVVCESVVRMHWTRLFASTTCTGKAKSSIGAAFCRVTLTGLCQHSSLPRGNSSAMGR
jgi:hypothetical protein